MAIGAEKSPNLETMNLFTNILHGTLFGEMELHRAFSKWFGISEETLLEAEASYENTAYTSYMLNHAQRGDAAVVAACLLTCDWFYNYIGKHLQASYNHDNNPYKELVDMDSEEKCTELNDMDIKLMNDLAEGKPERELKVLEEIVVTTSKYEYMFWDMCENKSDWKKVIDL